MALWFLIFCSVAVLIVPAVIHALDKLIERALAPRHARHSDRPAHRRERP